MAYKTKILLPLLTDIISEVTLMAPDIAKCEVSETKICAKRAKQHIWKIEKILVSLKSEINSIIKQ